MPAARTALRQRLSTTLASRSALELAELVGTGRVSSVGVGGGSALIDVDGVPVFTKRIPLTNQEVSHSGSTANLFDLPVSCNYGIGGRGFNAWRELAANIVTDAVLAGETQSFSIPSYLDRPHLARVRSNPRVDLVIDTEQTQRGDVERPNHQIRVIGHAVVSADTAGEWTRRIRRKYIDETLSPGAV